MWVATVHKEHVRSSRWPTFPLVRHGIHLVLRWIPKLPKIAQIESILADTASDELCLCKTSPAERSSRSGKSTALSWATCNKCTKSIDKTSTCTIKMAEDDDQIRDKPASDRKSNEFGKKNEMNADSARSIAGHSDEAISYMRYLTISYMILNLKLQRSISRSRNSWILVIEGELCGLAFSTGTWPNGELWIRFWSNKSFSVFWTRKLNRYFYGVFGKITLVQNLEPRSNTGSNINLCHYRNPQLSIFMYCNLIMKLSPSQEWEDTNSCKSILTSSNTSRTTLMRPDRPPAPARVSVIYG